MNILSEDLEIMPETPGVKLPGFSIKKLCLTSVLWMVFATIIIFIKNVSPWAATPIVLVSTILVPGLLLAANLRIRSEKTADYLIYSFGLGLAFLLIGGLLINYLLPALAILQPLAKIPLMISLDSSTLILVAWAYIYNKEGVIPILARWPDKLSLLFGVIPIFFMVASAAGAERLNNLASGTVTLCMLFAIAFYVFAFLYWRKRIQGWVYVSALYFISLSLLLMYSLRSSHILGWDINQEYQVFQMTLQNLVWKASYYPGLDYNACVSITILPTILKVLTNTPSEYIFKITFQILFALSPVALYTLVKRYLARSLAFLATFLFLSQTWFFEQMPALIRQEVAMTFYITILLVLFDKKISERTRLILFYIFTIAIILSHYSTAYVWFTLLIGVLLLSYVAKFFIKSLRGQQLVIKPMMLIISLVFLLIWQIPLTGTIGKITQFVTNTNQPSTISPSQSATSNLIKTSAEIPLAPVVLATSILTDNSVSSTSIAPKNIIKDAVLTTLLASPDQNTNENLIVLQKAVIRSYDTHIKYPVYPDADSSTYTPAIISDSSNVPRELPASLSVLIDLIARIAKILFIDVFPVIGMVGIYLSFRRQPSVEKYNFMLFSVGAYGFIVLMILIPYLQVYYNFSRLYLQMFFILSTLSVIGGVLSMKYLPRYRMIILTLLACIVFCSFSGAFDQITGGQARITLDQPPSTFDSYYIHDSEIASAQWLAAEHIPGNLVQSDIVANLRLQSFANTSATNFVIFPQTISVNRYMYLTSENIEQGKAYFEYNNNILVYNYPLDFVGNDKDLIYNDGGSEIYR